MQTSYNNNFRKRFASIGGKYDAVNNVFLYPQPYASWTLDSNYEWQPPTPCPDDGQPYLWFEDNQAWVINANPAAEV